MNSLVVVASCNLILAAINSIWIKNPFNAFAAGANLAAGIIILIVGWGGQ